MDDNKPRRRRRRNVALVFGEFFVRVVCEALFLVTAAVVCLECMTIRTIKKLSPKQLVLCVAILLCSLLLAFPPTREPVSPIQPDQPKKPTETKEVGVPKEADIAKALERVEHKLDHILHDSRQRNTPYNTTTEIVHISHHYHYTTNTTNITNNITINEENTYTILNNTNNTSNSKVPFERERHDYALLTSGARIVDSSRTYCVPRGGSRPPLCKNTPAHLLFPDGAAVRPGECWGLAGSSGFVVIGLREAVVPRAVAVVHPTRGEIGGAPRGFRVYGVNALGGKWEETLLGTFVYDARSPDVVQEFVLRKQSAAFRYVKVEVVSNWGNSAWTCLYKVKLFGTAV